MEERGKEIDSGPLQFPPVSIAEQTEKKSMSFSLFLT